eukprot:TRINITY_DN20004_c0_g1_i1.p1 TRINITY_DN20004_c0_g1~~TRINITY_DN20004_c0_g1_i1.p1  ORF type:complete len:375 (+),score=40.68 TRINITY_DN20004_c0_g1_i1:63-1127(+)
MQAVEIEGSEADRRETISHVEKMMRRLMENNTRLSKFKAVPQKTEKLPSSYLCFDQDIKGARLWTKGLGRVVAKRTRDSQVRSYLLDTESYRSQQLVVFEEQEYNSRRSIDDEAMFMIVGCCILMQSKQIDYSEKLVRKNNHRKEECCRNRILKTFRTTGTRFFNTRSTASGRDNTGPRCRKCTYECTRESGGLFCIACGIPHTMLSPCPDCGLVLAGPNSAYCTVTGAPHFSTNPQVKAKLPSYFTGSRWPWQPGGDIPYAMPRFVKEAYAGSAIYEAICLALLPKVKAAVSYGVDACSTHIPGITSPRKQQLKSIRPGDSRAPLGLPEGPRKSVARQSRATSRYRSIVPTSL